MRVGIKVRLRLGSVTARYRKRSLVLSNRMTADSTSCRTAVISCVRETRVFWMRSFSD